MADSFVSGLAKRKILPRGKLAQWNPDLRRETTTALLEHSVHDRIPALVQIKNQRMAQSPFLFFRGAACVMAYDLSRQPSTGILAQLCGDAHVANLGAYTGPDGRLIFDINDFDETIRGPFEWDVKRMATSLLLAAEGAKIKPAEALRAADLCLAAYARLIRELAHMPVLDAVRFQVHRLDAVAPISKILMKAERATPLHSLESLTEPTPAKARPGRKPKTAAPTAPSRQFKEDLPVLRRVIGDEAEAVLAAIPLFTQTIEPERRHFFAKFHPVDVAFKVVGTGSVGLRDYCVYLEAGYFEEDGQFHHDPLFLQIKQEPASTYAQYLTSLIPSEALTFENEGRRVAEGQRAMQLQSDPLLGWTRIDGRDYLVRQLNDHKASIDLTKLKAADLEQYATVCGELLARGHARSGDARKIAGYLGNGDRFGEAIAEFAKAYAEQTVEDWKHFRKAMPKA
jgi:uncharacterized protein (DUF2252 family)